MFGELSKICHADAVCAAHSSLHGHSYRHPPNGLETQRTAHLSQENRWRPSNRPCPNRRTGESAETTPMERTKKNCLCEAIALVGVGGEDDNRNQPHLGEGAATFCTRWAADPSRVS